MKEEEQYESFYFLVDKFVVLVNVTSGGVRRQNFIQLLIVLHFHCLE